MAMSGRDDPNMEPAIEMTSWGLDVLYKYTDCNFSDMPDDIKQKFIDFFNDRQDPETGFYIDKQGEVNWREAARTNSAVRYAFQKLKAEPRYPLPSENNDADSETGSTAKVIPDYFATVDTYIDWIESLDWDNASWGAGDIVGTHTLYFGYLDEENAKIYEDAMFEWLEKRQDPETGLWGKGINFNSISGAFKVAVIYANGKRTMPNAEKVIESVFKCYSMDRAVNPYFIRNPISLLLMIIQQNENLKGQIRQGVIDNIDTILLSFKDFLCPDGGFSAGKGKSMVAFGGVTGSHGLYEGDIDATLMMLIVRNELYSILGGKAPKLPADRFWAWITGEEALPSPYKDSSLAESSGDSVTINFDNFDAGYILAGDEFGGTLIDPILTAKIEADRNRKDNKILCLSYNGNTTSSAGPGITLSDPVANIKYLPPSISVAEFDIMVEDMKASANAYINFGSAPAYALSMNGSGVVNVTSRVAPDKTAYGGTMFKLSPKEWYHIRLEYDPISENDNATITYYVDGELLGQNSNYNGCHLGASPAEMNKCMQIYWYKAGKGKIYIDNVKLSNQHT